MAKNCTILTISGSDTTGESGIQSDLHTITALGAKALTAITSITTPGADGIPHIADLPHTLVHSQTAAAIATTHPDAIKIGLVRDPHTILALSQQVSTSPRLVLAPGIHTALGTPMMPPEAIHTFRQHLIPHAHLLMLRQRDARTLLGTPIDTDDDMKQAAATLLGMGARWVMLRGSQHTPGMLTTLLMSNQAPPTFFTTHNTEGWQRHGIAGALSAAITTRLGMGDDVPTAIRNAHDYMHSQVVYAIPGEQRTQRPIDLYNTFIGHVAAHYTEAHDVAYYARSLCVTPRYLTQITDRVAGKSPKQIITDYLISESKSYLTTTRLNTQEIAIKLGFSSDAMFCRFFKNHEGQSPGTYREHSTAK